MYETRVRSFQPRVRKGENGRVRGMKMIPAWSTNGDVGDAAFFLNEFRPVYFAYSIPPTKTRLSVFSRSALGRCGGKDILALKHIPSVGGCLRRLSRSCLRKFAIHPDLPVGFDYEWICRHFRHRYLYSSFHNGFMRAVLCVYNTIYQIAFEEADN